MNDAQKQLLQAKGALVAAQAILADADSAMAVASKNVEAALKMQPDDRRILSEVIETARRAVAWAAIHKVQEPWVEPLTKAVTNFDEMAPRGSDAT